MSMTMEMNDIGKRDIGQGLALEREKQLFVCKLVGKIGEIDDVDVPLCSKERKMISSVLIENVSR